MYKEKLRERDRRKTVVKELGLIEAFFKVGATYYFGYGSDLFSSTGKLPELCNGQALCTETEETGSQNRGLRPTQSFQWSAGNRKKFFRLRIE